MRSEPMAAMRRLLLPGKGRDAGRYGDLKGHALPRLGCLSDRFVNPQKDPRDLGRLEAAAAKTYANLWPNRRGLRTKVGLAPKVDSAHLLYVRAREPLVVRVHEVDRLLPPLEELLVVGRDLPVPRGGLEPRDEV